MRACRAGTARAGAYQAEYGRDAGGEGLEGALEGVLLAADVGELGEQPQHAQRAEALDDVGVGVAGLLARVGETGVYRGRGGGGGSK